MIRNDATQRQVDAADPTASTWLTANAGSGKTRVLTDRVARLLLQGVSPQNILCLTYTKAAAAEMQNRLFQRLGEWAMKEDDDLRIQLAELGAENGLDLSQLSRARTLFARAIETPGGLKIQTIHSFCGSILRRFPLEAGVSPQFQEMEDRAGVILRAEVIDAMSSGPERARVQDLLRHYTGAELDKLLGAITKHKHQFAKAGNLDEIDRIFGSDQSPDAAGDLQIAFPANGPEISEAVTACFAGSTKKYKDFASDLAALNLTDPTEEDFEGIKKLFLYAKDQTSKSTNFPPSTHKSAVALFEPVADQVHEWMDLVEKAHQCRLNRDMRSRTLALHAFAAPFITAYEARKLAAGLLDFDDLIEKAAALLTDSQVAQWVLYRLDGGIDHVLVDEAQDTSPAQWTVIQNLTQELTSGVSERNGKERTVFVVGDKKQSIYSFQGADPIKFDAVKDTYAAALASPGPGLNEQELLHSFRSSNAILRAVDQTFADEEKRAAIGWTDFHIPFHPDLPGRVDLWPAIPPGKEPETEKKWFEPTDLVSTTHHHVVMAEQVAAQIKHIIAHERLPTPNGRRRITEGDFLILVQSRVGLFPEIIRACKTAGLRVAGADRFRVGAVLAVRDIAALLNFLALPDDDLSLAAALRSPLFGWSEQDIFTLAHHRPEKGVLWEALRNSGHTETLAILHDLLNQADFLRPYDLIERILLRHDGRRNLLARLGAEAEDGIDALLSQALGYESRGTPSLTGFLSWMDTDELEIKRQMDSQGNQIRVMSVHGSKGLEAPIVILPDCAKRKSDIRDNILLQDGVPLWMATKTQESQVLLNLRDEKAAAQHAERLRLLYVAMTRAEQWLIVGAAGDLGNDGDSWHDVISNGFAHLDTVEATSGGLEIQRATHGDWDAGPEILPDKETIPAVPTPVFDPLPVVHQTTTLSPSDLGGAKILPDDTASDDPEDALARGRSFHLLLEHLPSAPKETRQDLAKRVLAAAPDLHSAEVEAQLISDALCVIDAPDLAPVFASDARAEVGITASLPELGGQRIHGAIDRLIIRDDHILAIDFKTNRQVPDDPGKTPEGLLRQMGAYAAALAQVYPDHRIETAILWTHTASLMPLPPPIIAAALERVTTS